MRILKHIPLYIIVAAMTLASCSQKDKDEKPAATSAPQKVVMDVPSGTKAPATEPVDTIPGQTHIKITCQCMATTDPDKLDEMPRSVKTARRDTALLAMINNREVFVVQPGETAYILQKDGNKLQLRFPDKIAWVMASDTK